MQNSNTGLHQSSPRDFDLGSSLLFHHHLLQPPTMGVSMSRPPEHLVDDGLDEEDEEKAEAEEELGEGIFQLQHCSRHHPQPCGSLQGLPHLAENKGT